MLTSHGGPVTSHTKLWQLSHKSSHKSWRSSHGGPVTSHTKLWQLSHKSLRSSHGGTVMEVQSRATLSCDSWVTSQVTSQRNSVPSPKVRNNVAIYCSYHKKNKKSDISVDVSQNALVHPVSLITGKCIHLSSENICFKSVIYLLTYLHCTAH